MIIKVEKDANKPENVVVTAFCQMCKGENKVSVNKQKWDKYNSGVGHPQDVFPELSADDRELLLSGTCPKCWDAMFTDEEKE